MKRNFMNSLYINLAERWGYMPIEISGGNVSVTENFRLFQKHMPRRHYIVDIQDGDVLTPYDIRYQMDTARHGLTEVNDGDVYYYFKIFVFDSVPDYFKMQEIVSGQLEEFFFRKFLACFTVDLSNKQVIRHFDSSVEADGLDRLVNSILYGGFYENVTSADIYERLEKNINENRLEYKVETPVATYVLIAINIGVWLMMNVYAYVEGYGINELLLYFGAKENLRIMLGEYWRLITPVFLHANDYGQLFISTHLFFNSYSLYSVGTFVEKLYSRGKFLFIYFVAGFTGGIASFAFSINPGVGASGAIFGLLGALLYFGVESPRVFKRYFGYNVIAITVINIIFGFSTPGIDNYAHLGGLTGGFLASAIVRVKDVRGRGRERFLALLVTVLVIAAGLYWGFHSEHNVELLRAIRKRML